MKHGVERGSSSWVKVAVHVRLFFKTAALCFRLCFLGLVKTYTEPTHAATSQVQSEICMYRSLGRRRICATFVDTIHNLCRVETTFIAQDNLPTALYVMASEKLLALTNERLCQ